MPLYGSARESGSEACQKVVVTDVRKSAAPHRAFMPEGAATTQRGARSYCRYSGVFVFWWLERYQPTEVAQARMRVLHVHAILVAHLCCFLLAGRTGSKFWLAQNLERRV